MSVEFADPDHIKIPGLDIDGEHARGIPDSDDFLSGQLPMNVSRECGDVGDVFHMGLIVEDGLMKMGNAPSLRDGIAQDAGELLGCLRCDVVAPGAKGCEKPILVVKHQISVHHGAEAADHEGVQLDVVFLSDIGTEIGETGGDSAPHVIQGVCPHPVDLDILPAVSACGQRPIIGTHQHGFDPCGTELHAHDGMSGFDDGFRVVLTHNWVILLRIR
jgi:hypothetical protein